MSDESLYIVLVCLFVGTGTSVTAGCIGIALLPEDGVVKKIDPLQVLVWIMTPLMFWGAVLKALLLWT